MNKYYFLVYSFLLYSVSYAEISKNSNIDRMGNPIDELSIFQEKIKEQDKSKSPNKMKAIDALSVKDRASQIKKNNHQKNRSIEQNHNKYIGVAVVNDDVITNVDIINMIKFIFFSSGKPYDKNYARMMFHPILNKAIYGRIYQQVANANGFKINDKEVDDRIEEIAKMNNMSVKDMEEHFKSYGMNIQIFRKNLKDNMLFSSIAQMMKDDISVSKSDIEIEKQKEINDMKHTRYHILEIHLKIDEHNDDKKVKENAESIHKLLHDGFDFAILAQSISQGNYNENNGDLGWIIEDDIEKSILPYVKKLQPGEFSPVIKTLSGYKIIFLLDKANPNQSGIMETTYKCSKVSIQYKSPLMSENELAKINGVIEDLLKQKNYGEFKKICDKNNIKIETIEQKAPNKDAQQFFESSLNKAVPMQSPIDEDYVDIYYTVEKNTPEMKVSSDKDIHEKILNKKASKMFAKNFKQRYVFSEIKIYDKEIEKLFK